MGRSRSQSTLLPEQRPRPAREIIDQAISENQINERLLYAFSSVFVMIGTLAICWGVVRNVGLATIGGMVSSTLFLPAMQMARRIREQNIALRLLEVPLDRSESAEEAARLLRDFFATAFNMDKMNHGAQQIPGSK
jgi:hypothetical protein